MLPAGIVASLIRARPLAEPLPQARRRWEWPLPLTLATSGAFLLHGKAWLADLSDPLWFAFILAWLFTAIQLSAFAVVWHAEGLAVRLGEPLGTPVLTLSVTGIEVMMISAVMLAGEGHATLARDAMFAVVMITLDGMLGLSLLLGGLRYREQTYNLQVANALLAVIVPLAVLGLPNYTASSPGPTLSPLQAGFLILMSTGLYAVFLAIQNVRHRDYFIAPDDETETAREHHPGDAVSELRSPRHHMLLLAYLFPAIALSKQLAVPIDYSIHAFRAPVALGRLLVAILILSPESQGAARAALANQMQRAFNILLGSALGTIGLTIPPVLAIGLITERSIVLGLDAVDTILLLTLAVSLLTFTNARTNVLLGAVHLLLFRAYLVLIFEK